MLISEVLSHRGEEATPRIVINRDNDTISIFERIPSVEIEQLMNLFPPRRQLTTLWTYYVESLILFGKEQSVCNQFFPFRCYLWS